MPEPNPSSLTWGSHLFTPANNAGFLVHLPLLGARSVILDLEYATKLEDKHDGRLLAGGAIQYIRELGAPEPMSITVRLNMPRAWPILREDLESMTPFAPDSFRIPAVDDPADIERIAKALDELEPRLGISRPIALHPMIENPVGLSNIEAIAQASERVEALALGGEDWVRSIGAQRTKAGRELDHVRERMVIAAARAGVGAVDTIFGWLDDPEGLEADSRLSREMGFHGRATTNPRQVATIDRVYVPSEGQRVWAARTLADLRIRRVDGVEFFSAHGVVLDPHAVRSARRIAAFQG